MSIQTLHNRSMHYADLAFAEKRKGQNGSAQALFAIAYPLEAEAASLVPNEPDNEPTYSILYSSAASMAVNACDYEAGLRLAEEGLKGTPTVYTCNVLMAARAAARKGLGINE